MKTGCVSCVPTVANDNIKSCKNSAKENQYSLEHIFCQENTCTYYVMNGFVSFVHKSITLPPPPPPRRKPLKNWCFFFSAIIVTVPSRLGKCWVLNETQKSFNGGSNLIDSQVDNSSDFDMHMNSPGLIESILRL